MRFRAGTERKAHFLLRIFVHHVNRRGWQSGRVPCARRSGLNLPLSAIEDAASYVIFASECDITFAHDPSSAPVPGLSEIRHHNKNGKVARFRGAGWPTSKRLTPDPGQSGGHGLGQVGHSRPALRGCRQLARSRQSRAHGVYRRIREVDAAAWLEPAVPITGAATTSTFDLLPSTRRIKPKQGDRMISPPTRRPRRRDSLSTPSASTPSRQLDKSRPSEEAV